MAQILGRHIRPCPSCDFNGVHVKQNEGKLPYTHCPDCGLMCAAKNGQQAAGLLRNTRANKIDQAAPPPAPPVAENPIVVPPEVAALAVPTPAPAPAPAAPAKPAGLWDSLMKRG